MGRSAPDDVANLVRSWIHIGQLGPGDKLPTERELSAKLGVSRPTLREGLRQLSVEGYLGARRGNAGGTFVTDLARPRSMWLEHARKHPRWVVDWFEFRKAIETRTATLAAQHHTPDELTAIRNAVDDMRRSEDRVAFRQADHSFHLAIAEASGSDRLRSAVLQVRGELFPSADLLDYDCEFSQTTREHAAVLRAIEKGRASAAAKAMETHLEAALRDLLNQLSIENAKRS